MRNLDFSSWQGALTTLLGLAIFTLLGVGIRVLMMMTIQQRRERMNRQINERLRTLIAAYRTLGGSFTGKLTVDPTHLADTRAVPAAEPSAAAVNIAMSAADAHAGTTGVGSLDPHEAGAGPIASTKANADPSPNSDRARRIRDAVEAALADIILLGTEEQVRLASRAASEMAAGRPIHTAELVVALRNFIREALDLEPIPADVNILLQGPTRIQGGGAGRGKGNGNGGGGGGGGGAGGGGMGGGLGLGQESMHGTQHEA